MTPRKTTPLLVKRGPEHAYWKGDGASYQAFHMWIRRHFPNTGRCEYCGSREHKTDYASASHDRYTRNRADWFELCRSCHMRFDGRIGPRDDLRGPRVTHCRYGHEYTPDNTYTDPRGRRKCRACHRAESALARQNRKAVAA